MPVLCPTAADFTIAASAFGVVVAFLAGMVGHGVLRPLLEARGVSPWALRDSLGSMPTILIGSALSGGSSGGLIAILTLHCLENASVVVLLLAILAVGLISIKLGLVALRKLV